MESTTESTILSLKTQILHLRCDAYELLNENIKLKENKAKFLSQDSIILEQEETITKLREENKLHRDRIVIVELELDIGELKYRIEKINKKIKAQGVEIEELKENKKKQDKINEEQCASIALLQAQMKQWDTQMEQMMSRLHSNN
jgi:hypothetical protein